MNSINEQIFDRTKEEKPIVRMIEYIRLIALQEHDCTAAEFARDALSFEVNLASDDNYDGPAG